VTLIEPEADAALHFKTPKSTVRVRRKEATELTTEQFNKAAFLQ
jgi:hypothetical protein